MITELLYAPRDSWLALLLAGWRFCGDIAEPMPGGHGEWSVMIWRPA